MNSPTPVALITGAAHRLGAHTARHLHGRGWNIVIHYRSRQAQAEALARFAQFRPGIEFLGRHVGRPLCRLALVNGSFANRGVQAVTRPSAVGLTRAPG